MLKENKSYSRLDVFVQNHPYQNLEQLSHIAIVSFYKGTDIGALSLQSIAS